MASNVDVVVTVRKDDAAISAVLELYAQGLLSERLARRTLCRCIEYRIGDGEWRRLADAEEEAN